MPAILQNGEVLDALRRAAISHNISLDALRVGSARNHTNPYTGVAEFDIESEDSDGSNPDYSDDSGMEEAQGVVQPPMNTNGDGGPPDAANGGVGAPTPMTVEEIEQLVKDSWKNKNFGGVKPDYNLASPNEQMWVLRNGQFEYLGGNGGILKRGRDGDVIENHAKTTPGYDAIIHTHPYGTDPEPGPGDTPRSVPFFGVSPNRAWVIRPGETQRRWLK